MNRKKLNSLIAAVIVFFATSAFSESPHWDHAEQSTWWAIEDTTQTYPPKRFPFAVCGVGQHQSPIDLAAAEVNDTIQINPLEILYDVDHAPVFFNSGHGIQVNTSIEYSGKLKVGEELFPLIQFHFHSPGEHVIGNTTFPAELHYVHIQAGVAMLQDQIANRNYRFFLPKHLAHSLKWFGKLNSHRRY